MTFFRKKGTQLSVLSTNKTVIGYTYILTFALNNLQWIIDVYGKQCDLFKVNLVGLWWEEGACFKKVYTAQKHVMIEVKAV